MADAKQTYEDAKHNLDDAATEAKARAKSVVEDVTSQAKSVASEARETITSEVTARADAAKSAAAGEVRNVASALRQAAAESRHGSPQERTFGQIADTLADASDAISNKDLGTVISDASDFARRHPLTFLAGATLAGFAVSRFIKASERHAQVADTDEFIAPRHGNARVAGQV